MRHARNRSFSSSNEVDILISKKLKELSEGILSAMMNAYLPKQTNSPAQLSCEEALRLNTASSKLQLSKVTLENLRLFESKQFTLLLTDSIREFVYRGGKQTKTGSLTPATQKNALAPAFQALLRTAYSQCGPPHPTQEMTTEGLRKWLRTIDEKSIYAKYISKGASKIISGVISGKEVKEIEDIYKRIIDVLNKDELKKLKDTALQGKVTTALREEFQEKK